MTPNPPTELHAPIYGVTKAMGPNSFPFNRFYILALKAGSNTSKYGLF
jgi:hypothetical protein